MAAYLLTSMAATNDGCVILVAGPLLELYRYDLAGGSAAVDLRRRDEAASMASIMGASLDGDSVITGDSGVTWPFLRRYDATDGTFTAAQLPDYAGSNYVTVDRSGHRFGAGGPGATYACVAGGDHMVARDRPYDVASIVRKHLAARQ